MPADAHAQHDPVEVGRRGAPEPRLGDPRRGAEEAVAATADRGRREPQGLRADPALDDRVRRAVAEIPDDRADADGRRARGAGQRGPSDDVHEIEAIDLSEVDLAEDARIVPPAADVAAASADRDTRHVELAVAAVDPHDEDVGATGPRVAEGHLERQIPAGVTADPVAVQPHRRPVVHRLETHDPGSAGTRTRAARSPCGTTRRRPGSCARSNRPHWPRSEPPSRASRPGSRGAASRAGDRGRAGRRAGTTYPRPDTGPDGPSW